MKIKILLSCFTIFLILYSSVAFGKDIVDGEIHPGYKEEILEFKYEECSATMKRDATIDIRRLKDTIYTIEIESFFNCACVPSDPKLNYSNLGITLSVDSFNKYGGMALSNCVRKMYIKIKLPFESEDMIESLGDFYYVQDNNVLGHIPFLVKEESRKKK